MANCAAKCAAKFKAQPETQPRVANGRPFSTTYEQVMVVTPIALSIVAAQKPNAIRGSSLGVSSTPPGSIVRNPDVETADGRTQMTPFDRRWHKRADLPAGALSLTPKHTILFRTKTQRHVMCRTVSLLCRSATFPGKPQFSPANKQFRTSDCP